MTFLQLPGARQRPPTISTRPKVRSVRPNLHVDHDTTFANESLEGNAVFQIFGPDGRPFSSAERDSVAREVPETADYTLRVGSTRGNASFELRVALRTTSAIVFEPGLASKTLPSASVVRGERAYFTIAAGAGRDLEVSTLSADSSKGVVQIWDFAGNRMTRAPAEAVRTKLPSDGRALIEVGSSRGNATYKLTVAIP